MPALTLRDEVRGMRVSHGSTRCSSPAVAVGCEFRRARECAARPPRMACAAGLNRPTLSVFHRHGAVANPCLLAPGPTPGPIPMRRPR